LTLILPKPKWKDPLFAREPKHSAPCATIEAMPPDPKSVNESPAPTATITRRAADRLRAGHLWVYRSDIEPGTARLEPPTPPPGALVTVVDPRAIPLGTALYSDASEIALRIVSRRPGLTRADYLSDLRERLPAALHLRARLVPEAFSSPAEAPATNACRLIFSEADDLPGIVADRYNDIVVLQLLTQGTAQDDVRRAVVEVLSAHPWLTTAVERPDPRIREFEHLAPAPTEPLYLRPGAAPTLSTIFTINGLRFHFDAASGQKTGAFLDQRLNYAAAAHHAHGHALDICTYQGGFALHLARTCTTVTGVDASRTALEVADRNLALNPTLTAQVAWIEADAFDLLREWESSGKQFDTIVLDPPAFAKSKRAAEGALRGYKELNLRALKMLAPGGTLVTCSCSHHVALDDFLSVLRAAASDAGRRVQLLEIRTAAPDHPAILTLPETAYLKCLICRVE
jgi:23S rRNA (cytosine1962-C5)-methyltransferase